MKKFCVFLFIVFAYIQAAYSQALHVDSTRFITGDAVGTNITYAINTTDNGILFVGFDVKNPKGIIPYFPMDTILENVLIGKIDSNKHISWIKVYGGSQDDAGGPACQTPDGGYAILAGTTSNNGDVTGFKGAVDIWLLRIDANGNLLWEKTYGSSESDGPISIANTTDHGFMILGSTNGSDGDVPFHYGSFFSNDWLVIKTDSLGNIQWSKDLGGTGEEINSGSILAVDNNYFLISSSTSTDHDCTDTSWHAGIATTSDYHILKLDDTGRVLWDSSYGGSRIDICKFALFDTRDSSIVVVGSSESADFMVTGNHGGGDVWMTKTNKNGALLSQHAYGDSGDQSGTGICEGVQGGYLVYGASSGMIGGRDAWIIYTDNSGEEITNKIFGGVNNETPYSVVPYGKGFAATGLSGSYSFSEGTTYGNFDTSDLNPDGGGAFISYIDYWPLAVNNVSALTDNTLVVYPNPASEKASIEVKEKGNCELVITDIIGQVVYKANFDGTTVVSVNGWKKGMYFVEVINEAGYRYTQKLLVA